MNARLCIYSSRRKTNNHYNLVKLAQGLFQKVRAYVQFFRKMTKKGKLFQNLGKNV